MDTNIIKKEAVKALKLEIDNELSIENINSDDNLIEKGLSSIMIMKISNKLRKLGVRVSFAKLMENPTIDDWESLINVSKVKIKVKKNEDCFIAQKEYINVEFPLTDVQYAYWVGRDEDQILGGVGCHAYLEIDGEDIDVKKLKKAWNTLQNNHPMLRAKFNSNGTQQIMKIPYSNDIDIYNLNSLEKKEVDKKLEKIRSELSHRKLKVEQGQVAGISIALFSKNKTRIFLDMDLLIADVMSLSIIISDLSKIYMGNLKEVPVKYTFKDYVDNNRDKKSLEEDKIFWENKIENYLTKEPPDIPLKVKPELLKETKFVRRKKIIDKIIWNKIKDKASSYKMTPSMVLLGCYSMIVERWTNQEEFVINMPLFNRDTENEFLENMVADFTNLLIVEYKRKENETILQIIKRLSSTFLENVFHSSYSGVQVQRDIFKNIGNNNNIAPIVFACNIDYPLETLETKKALGKITYMISQTPGVWLDFQTYIVDGDLILCWDAVEELYPEELLNDMFKAFSDLILSLVDNEDWNFVPDVLTKNQKKLRQEELNNVLSLDFEKKTLYDDFIMNTKNNPNKIAIIDAELEKKITYKELYDESIKLASKLVSVGVSENDYVAITLPRGYKQIISILGILFTGAAYVPIGINQPKERRNKIYDQISIKYVVSDSQTFDSLELNKDKVFVLKIDEIDFDKNKILSEPVKIKSNKSAYVIMTSGTTGTPKGVEICHENAMNTIIDINDKYNMLASDSIIMVSSIDFDLSVYDMFGILSVGGKIITLNEENYKDPDLWLELISKYEVTLWDSVPILFDMLITMAEGRNEQLKLKVVMLSGDWINIMLPERFYNRSFDSIVVAMGGATEASIWSNYLNVPKKIPSNWNSIPYGKALKNQNYRVVDDFDRICPNYVKGELLIGGIGVAKCYRGDEMLTKKKFIIKDGIRWYRTGDNGRTWNDGTIEFLGRSDKQVKIKGHRIEIGEIENSIKELESIDNVKIVADTERNSIYAFIVNNSFEEKDILYKLSKKIVGYMLPDKIISINELPLNRNHKIDNNKLILLGRESRDRSLFTEIKMDYISSEILQIYRKHLKNMNFMETSNYFEYGGDSLTAIKIITEIDKKLKINIKVSEIFNNATVLELVNLINNKDNSDKDDELINNKGYELTNLQKSYWLSFMKKNKVAYFYIEIEINNINKSKLSKSIIKILKENAIFENVISLEGTRFLESMEFIEKFDIEEYDDSCNKYEDEFEKIRIDIIKHWENKLIPLKAIISKNNLNENILHLVFNSIYFDATSIMIFLENLNSLYSSDKIAICKDEKFDRNPLIQYTTNMFIESKKYWEAKKIFKSPLICETQKKKFEIKRYEFELEQEFENELEKISKKEGITVSNLILSVFSKIISRWSGQNEFALNIVITNPKAEIYETFGNIADYTGNILCNISYDKYSDLSNNAKNIQKTLGEDLSYIAYDGVDVLRMIRRKVDKSYNSPIVYTYTANSGIELNVSKLGSIKYIESYTPNVYLDCQVSRINNKLNISWDCRMDKFIQSELESFFDDFKIDISELIIDESMYSLESLEEGLI